MLSAFQFIFNDLIHQKIYTLFLYQIINIDSEEVYMKIYLFWENPGDLGSAYQLLYVVNHIPTIFGTVQN